MNGLSLEQFGGLVVQFSLNLVNGAVDIGGFRAVPFCFLRVEGDQIPKCARVPATTRVFGVQLGTQLFGDQVVLVPKLSNPCIRNPV